MDSELKTNQDILRNDIVSEVERYLGYAEDVHFVVSTKWGDQYPLFQKHVADAFGWNLEEA